MAEVGRPTELNEETLVKIKQGVLDGKLDKEIAEDIGVPYDTFAGWKKRNYDNFADHYLTYEHERKIRKASKKIEELISSEDEKVALNASTFIAETLGKTHYSKRNEVTGANGDKIEVSIISYANNNSPQV